MAYISGNNRKYIDDLCEEYNSAPWWKSPFYPKALAKALQKFRSMNDEPTHLAFNVCKAFDNKTWFFQRWLFPSLASFSETALAKTYQNLRDHGYLNGDSARNNFEVIAQNQDPSSTFLSLLELDQAGLLSGGDAAYYRRAVSEFGVAHILTKALVQLQQAKLLTGEKALANFKTAARERSNFSFPSYIAETLEILQGTPLLKGDAAQANFDAIASYENPREFRYVLYSLRKHTLYYKGKENLLNGDEAQNNFNTIIAIKDKKSLDYLVKFIDKFHETTLLTGKEAQNNFNAILKHKDFLLVVEPLIEDWSTKLFNGDGAQANFDAILGAENPKSVTWALCTLEDSGLLAGDDAQVYRDIVARNQKPQNVAWAIAGLKDTGFLNSDFAKTILDTVATHNSPGGLTDALSKLKDTSLLTGDEAQNNFNALKNYKYGGGQWVFSSILDILRETGLLNSNVAQDNFNTVVAHKEICALFQALSSLKGNGLFARDQAQAYFNAVAAHTNPVGVAWAIENLEITIVNAVLQFLYKITEVNDELLTYLREVLKMEHEVSIEPIWPLIRPILAKDMYKKFSSLSEDTQDFEKIIDFGIGVKLNSGQIWELKRTINKNENLSKHMDTMDTNPDYDTDYGASACRM